jgi:hypothetical protein
MVMDYVKLILGFYPGQLGKIRAVGFKNLLKIYFLNIAWLTKRTYLGSIPI